MEKELLRYIANLLDPEGEPTNCLSPDDMIRSLIIQYFHEDKELGLRIAEAGNHKEFLRAIVNVNRSDK